jgi:peptidoglycan/xylan/chitin deacetylase (PgdA/CDA1 family)
MTPGPGTGSSTGIAGSGVGSSTVTGTRPGTGDGTAVAALDRGAMVVSIDTELAWGLAHRRGADGRLADLGAESGHLGREREVVAAILDLFARFEIHGTWAVVGHLFLDRCRPGPGGRRHPEIVRPAYPWLEGDWFDIDPGTSRDDDPFFYAPDIVDLVAACPVEQEIASHGFSHVIAGEAGCSAEAFASELTASQAVAGERGIALRSFVYPRNAIGHLATLAASGFTSYRGSRPAPFPGVRGWRRRVVAVADRLRPRPGSTVSPLPGPGGLWNIPQTYLFAPATSRRRLPPAIWARQPVARLHQAARQRSLFHLWFHPYNVTAAPERALAALERICAAAAAQRDRGRLDVVTMGQLAERLGPPEPVAPQPAGVEPGAVEPGAVEPAGRPVTPS